MSVDKRRSYITTALFPIAVALSLLMPGDIEKNWALATICIGYAVLSAMLVKKRNILSLDRKIVAVIVTAACMIMVAISFMLGMKFGFVKNPFTRVFIWKYILPFAAIVISSEQMRRVLLSERGKLIYMYTLLAFALLDCMMQVKQGTFDSFKTFVSFIGLTAFPALSSNILCNMLALRYGALPGILFRLITVLWRYFFPILPNTPDILLSLFRFVFPLFLAVLIYLIFFPQRQTKHRKAKLAERVIFGSLCIVSLFLAMLISCQFTYRFLVIASPSMTGAIDKGDGIIYRAYENEEIKEGQVIVFKKGEIQIIHRVVDIQYIDGEFRYITRGDANDSNDPWQVRRSDIEGIVLWRLRYVGFPTLALRSLFG